MASSGVVGPARGAGQSQLPGALGQRTYLPALLLIGCGGGAPLLHPAHALPLNTVSFGAGVSGQFESDDFEGAIERGRSAATGALSDPATARAYSEGVFAHALVAPGLSPWVAARVGLPWATEAGLTYTGRALRIDGRRVIALGEGWALSLGLGASALLLSPDSSSIAVDPSVSSQASPEAEFELNATGWGGDVPMLIGHEAINGFVDVWAGPRVGFERIDGELRSEASDPGAPRIDAAGHRWWAGALAGFSLGVPPLWFRFELATTFHRLSGKLTAAEADAESQPAPDFGSTEANGWTLCPSGAIIGKF